MMIIAGIFGAVLMTAFGTYYFQNKKRKRKNALLCKALATSVPGVLVIFHLCDAGFMPDMFAGGNIAAQTAGGTVTHTVAAFIGTLAAIVCYMVADVLLECRFIWGAVSFAAGHVCMTAGFLMSGESVLRITEGGDFRIDTGLLGQAAAGFVLMAAAACLALRKYFHALKKKKLFIPLLAYILILGVMAALAVTAGIRIWEEGMNVDSTGSLLRGMIPAAGGVCFTVSDILLGRNRMGRHRSAVCGALVLILYYMSVYLLAMRLWI